jgi:hypothetical protein
VISPPGREDVLHVRFIALFDYLLLFSAGDLQRRQRPFFGQVIYLPGCYHWTARRIVDVLGQEKGR